MLCVYNPICEELVCCRMVLARCGVYNFGLLHAEVYERIFWGMSVFFFLFSHSVRWAVPENYAVSVSQSDKYLRNIQLGDIINIFSHFIVYLSIS